MQIQSFKDLPLTGEILRSIEELGFESLFPIQAQAIMPLLEGKDVIGQAQTGTGKTAAFGIPMVQRLNREVRGVQGLILVPTRELAVQVARSIGTFCEIRKNQGFGCLRWRINQQANTCFIKRCPHCCRYTWQINRPHGKARSKPLSLLRMVVLDEADRMLDMGFIEDIEFILSKTPHDRQTSLFSATIDESVMRVCNKYMKNPQKILVSKDEIALTQMKQYYTVVSST